MLGGQSVDGPLSSIEAFGFEDDNKCNIPKLPETRYGFAAFKTFSNQLAVCGGWWQGKPNSTDCLTLDTSEAQWVRGTFEGKLFGEGVRGVATFEDHGIYISHTWSTSHLTNENYAWAPGPDTPVEVECACRVSKSSFVIVGSNSRNNVLEYSVVMQRWEGAETWPEMRRKRKGPACAATSHHLMVAGGVTDQGEVLASVEIFRLDSKFLGAGREMLSPRSFFTLVPVGLIRPRLLAIGGRNEHAFLKSSEFWEEEENEWQEGPHLGRERSSFGAIMIEGDFVCTHSLPPHSCLATENVTCTFSDSQGTYKYIIGHPINFLCRILRETGGRIHLPKYIRRLHQYL